MAEIINMDAIEQSVRRRGRPVTAPWRHKEDGTYDNNPCDPEYFKKYYHDKIKCKITCDICGRLVGQQKIKRHQQTKVCKSIINNNNL